MAVGYIWRSRWIHHLSRVERTFAPHRWGEWLSCLWLVRYSILSLLSLTKVATQGEKINSLVALSCIIYICMQVRITSASYVQLTFFIRLAEHLTARRAWCKQFSAWSIKARRVPCQHYCRDARAYGHTTTVMHGIGYPPPPFPIYCI